MLPLSTPSLLSKDVGCFLQLFRVGRLLIPVAIVSSLSIVAYINVIVVAVVISFTDYVVVIVAVAKVAVVCFLLPALLF